MVVLIGGLFFNFIYFRGGGKVFFATLKMHMRVFKF